ncbi:hypothetical protein [Methanobrevibacter sp.]|uniref:hypothetical protein n=1 Tax=Methanobrevibacter sp. TaxID=66852 RepID=UPI00388F691E
MDDSKKCPLCGVDFEKIVPEKIGRFGYRSKQKKIQNKFEEDYGIEIDELKNNLIRKTFFEKKSL